MNLIIYLIAGAIVGYVASRAMRTNSQQGLLLDIVVGVVGAFLAGYFISPLLSVGTINDAITLPTLLVTLLGSVVLLWIYKMVAARPENAKNLPKSAQEIQSPISPKIQQKVETQSLPRASSKKVLSGIIFVSYRRTDSADVTGRIYDRLVEGFGRASIFKDVDSIPLGSDFKEYLDEKVSECNVLLAIIGDRWLEASDSMGRSRLEDPNDFVRIEIESALARGIPVIPLLVRGAFMPSEEKLPASLRKLVYRNGIQIRPDPDFHRDMERLISALKKSMLTPP
jgi:uncharacterized membrane protein YeaQ/YmgE (transglycosylase-associated protein family)